MASKYEWLIVGLGNPGRKYESTRHNVGWMSAFAFCEKHKKKLLPGSTIYYQAELKYAGSNLLIIAPTTFMNASGEAVAKVSAKYEIKPSNIIIVCDEYNFPVGKMHLKKGGSDGGHNGVFSVIEELGTADFYRLRLGIGKNFPPGGMVDYVLSDFEDAEIQEKDIMISRSIDALHAIAKLGAQRAMSVINSEELWKPKVEKKESELSESKILSHNFSIFT